MSRKLTYLLHFRTPFICIWLLFAVIFARHFFYSNLNNTTVRMFKKAVVPDASQGRSVRDAYHIVTNKCHGCECESLWQHWNCKPISGFSPSSRSGNAKRETRINRLHGCRRKLVSIPAVLASYDLGAIKLHLPHLHSQYALKQTNYCWPYTLIWCCGYIL